MAKEPTVLNFGPNGEHYQAFLRALQFYVRLIKQYMDLEVDDTLREHLEDLRHRVYIRAGLLNRGPDRTQLELNDDRKMYEAALTTRFKHLITVGDNAADCHSAAMRDIGALQALLVQLGALPHL